ncbi:hypothetical protein P7C70_g9185, partial [Phenoliferia sp. Uapishka_3]
MSDERRTDAGLSFSLVVTFSKVISGQPGRSRKALDETHAFTITMKIPGRPISDDYESESEDEEDLPTFDDFIFLVLDKAMMHSDILSPILPLIKYKFKTPAVGPLSPLTEEAEWEVVLSELADKKKGTSRIIHVFVPWPEAWGGVQRTVVASRGTTSASAAVPSSNKAPRGGGFLDKVDAAVEEIKGLWPVGTNDEFPHSIVVYSGALGSHVLTDASVRSWATMVVSLVAWRVGGVGDSVDR